MLVDEPVSLSAYDPTWPHAAFDEMNRIVTALGTTAGTLEHIGSTAVEGLLAKPIIDLMLGIARILHRVPQNDIRRLGYEALGEAGVAGRCTFANEAGASSICT
jgi:GrpB-like predicted nucleotidyltransferase (UPF0157 family)